MTENQRGTVRIEGHAFHISNIPQRGDRSVTAARTRREQKVIQLTRQRTKDERKKDKMLSSVL